MKLIAELIDDQYEDSGFNHTRNIVRAVLINEQNQIALNKIKGEDIFGVRDYYELPGGGVNQEESFEDAIRREIQEEVGYNSYIVEEIGLIIDYYNLIKRKNHNHFYLCKTLNFVGKQLEEREIILIEKLIWVDIDEAIKIYESMQNINVGRLVKQRELPILRIARELIMRL